MTAAARTAGPAADGGLLRELSVRIDRGEDEAWIGPLIARGRDGEPVGRVRPGDTVIFCCRRGEREAQLTEAFVDPGFARFARVPLPGLDFVPLVETHPRFGIEPLVPPLRPERPLGEVIAQAGLGQLLVTETEKRAHVTYYFNGRRAALFGGQEARVVDAAPTPDPAMRSREVGKAAADGLADHHLVLVNFAAGDVIGHLQDFEAKVQAVRAVDRALEGLAAAAEARGAALLVTADHGLLEKGLGSAHTTNPVPFVASTGVARLQGTLADIAPTVLGLLGLRVPAPMSGSTLLDPAARAGRVALVILDGWGVGDDDPRGNPIAAAAPALEALCARHGRALLEASGAAVGLPEGRAGNSETGHLTIGAGRVIEQDELRVMRAFAEGFAGRPRLAAVLRRAAGAGALHLLGLLSDSSSHGTIGELVALARLAWAAGVRRVLVHLILDGHGGAGARATDLLRRHAAALAPFSVVTAVGRGYALDRGGDYGRTEVAYRALVAGAGALFDPGPGG